MPEKFKENRAKKDFARRQAYQRTGMPRVLIVTEGAVTEVEYFTDMCRSLGLSPITVHPAEGIGIIGKECGSAPINVFEYARRQFFEQEPKEKGIAKQYYWDEVYCVFDRDMHTTYHKALAEIQSTQHTDTRRIFRAITSHRCFELWFLLHFQYTLTDFSNTDDVIRKLKKIQHDKKYIFENYTHGSKGIFNSIKNNTVTAKSHADTLNSSHQNIVDKPHTLVVDLVNRIEEIAELCKTLGVKK